MHRTGFLILTALVAAPVGAQQLEIHHIDVDQGDATLVVTPNGSTLLIDSGLDSRGDEVASFLQSQGITQLDAFLNTHYDSDHYGGIDKIVAAGITVDSWFERGERQHLPASNTQPNWPPMNPERFTSSGSHVAPRSGLPHSSPPRAWPVVFRSVLPPPTCSLTHVRPVRYTCPWVFSSSVGELLAGANESARF